MRNSTEESAPERIAALSNDELYTIPLPEQHRIQLAAARKRFHELRAGVSMLAQLAEEQGITDIHALEDLGPLLIPHSALKSYPLSYLENSRFDRLTRWLDGFTTHDLSGIDATACDTIDDWLELLDGMSEVRVMHSSGTTGKLSFLPRGTVEMHRMIPIYAARFQPFRNEQPLIDTPLSETPFVFCGYRRGGMGQNRLIDYLESDLYDGRKDMILAANPGRFSADVASIGGRLRVAESKGELGTLSISPKLLARRDRFLEEQKNASAIMDGFLSTLAEHYRGKTVIINGTVPLLYNLAVEGLRRGYEGMFSPRSYLPLLGGTKGQAFPDDWQSTVLRFFGAEKMEPAYGMTEMMGGHRLCPGGHYHLPMWIIPYLLDPATGAQFPRTGTHMGRLGFYDLNTETYWGGFLSGDAVTLCWGDHEPCACGRIGPYLHREIRRYSESEGGDDKITCAGAPDAHDKAIDFLLRQIG